MMDSPDDKVVCVVGASHAGVTCAFALRREGWPGRIILFDADPELPYHRPPLSKAFLTSELGVEHYLLKPRESYLKDAIELRLGVQVANVQSTERYLTLADGRRQYYEKLVLATGARPCLPPIKGMADAKNVFPLRTAQDITRIREALLVSRQKRVLIIGGGYIGLETAASLRKMGAEVNILEREERILHRVTCPFMSEFFRYTHQNHGVIIETGKQVVAVESSDAQSTLQCSDGSSYQADVIIMGTGVRVNTALGSSAGVEIENGIKVDPTARTSDEHIYSIGDCTFHFNPHYRRYVRLESVQNAIDQAKVAAAAMCGKNVYYDAIPWFWSDQYDIKLQIAGLSQGFDNLVVRKEDREDQFSVWYFKGQELLAVDAVNNAKAYVMGTRLIRDRAIINKEKLADPAVALKSLV
ncbi:NAD(P)/FAD-dependent oxidoreductase [Persicitalea jodogahamensis]|uniref:Putative ferredoxin reductase n=1 Tax=Persicitalea jodogahamensis TaxID=402147 RepID=A0A8J3D5P0_9BACT|nr:FAD-dependent oxidoreductase [Persicitalea jodogahamensis]GHB63576.1 putative ferredoxin reductase [Persicitalea jodogahamensis]